MFLYVHIYGALCMFKFCYYSEIKDTATGEHIRLFYHNNNNQMIVQSYEYNINKNCGWNHMNLSSQSPQIFILGHKSKKCVTNARSTHILHFG